LPWLGERACRLICMSRDLTQDGRWNNESRGITSPEEIELPGDD